MDVGTTEGNQRLQLALKAGGLATWDWDIRSGEVTWSDEHYRIQGYNPGAVIPSFQAWLDRVHPDDREEAIRVLEEARAQRADYAHRFRCLWPNGAVRNCAARGLFFYDDAGNAVRMIGVMEDITDEHEAERLLRESDARFRQFGEASSDVLWVRDAATLALEYLSPAFDTIYGEDRCVLLAHPALARWLDLIVPEDHAALLADIERVRAGERVVSEYRILQKGSIRLRSMRNTQFPIRNERGDIVRIGGISHDATRERESADRMQVMMAELQHRTRNLMAVVQSISIRTLRESQSLGQFQTLYLERLSAVARVQGLLSRLPEGDRVTFDQLLGEELQAHGIAHGRVDVHGPPGVQLRSSALQILALALHELTTNAVKYGALACEHGRLAIRWNVLPCEDGRHALHVDWREVGASCEPADYATSGGYGRELIEQALPHQLMARTSYAITPEGVHCRLEVPLDQRPEGAALQRHGAA